jgi:glycosyltransferase involved in cell wall biosynthesis
MSASRLAMLPDFAEEQWPSMDLVAEQLLLGLRENHSAQFEVHRNCPAFVRCSGRLLGQRGAANNIDRLFNRFVTYPRFARKISRDFALFHLCDHSYGQVIHSLPSERVGVFCHDLDTFRCLLDPASEPRPKWFRAMTRRILSGMQKAAIVFHATQSVRSQIEEHGLIDPARLVHAPLGVAAEFYDAAGLELVSHSSHPTLLHVGSCIPRKRIDVLLEVLAAVRQRLPDVRLIQIGGEFVEEQQRQIGRLGIEKAITQVKGLSRQELAQRYRSASLVLITSEAEGFGLPVAEALATGAAVLATDIPVLREVGGEAATYAPLADVDDWADKAQAILENPAVAPPRSLRLERARQFSWTQHAATVAAAYRSLL